MTRHASPTNDPLALAPSAPTALARPALARSALVRLAGIPCLALALALGACTDDSSDGGSSGDAGNGGGDGPTTGTGGSLARMTIAGDYLYAIKGPDEVQLFDITTPSRPLPFVDVRIEFGLETLFPYGDYLLVGGADGVYVLDNTEPANPVFLSRFEHARAIDPVVAQDDVAYVTLREREDGFGGTVPGGEDSLTIIDISAIATPTLVRTIAMQGPSGLSVDGDRLYVCDGRAGIKIFDIASPTDPMFAGVVPRVDCRDVIVRDDLMQAITADELLQYDASSDEPVLLSRIGTGGAIVDR